MMRFFANKALLGLYGGLWTAARPFLRRHKRLREGFDERLVSPSWPDGIDPVPDGTHSLPAEAEPVSIRPEFDPTRRDPVPDNAASTDDTPSPTHFSAPGALRIWIQAASGGEAWLVHSLAPALLQALGEHPKLTQRPAHLLCTTCTRQGLDVLERLSLSQSCPEAHIFPRYFPLDDPALMEKAIQQAAPHLLVLLETELWPGLLAAAKKKAVPVAIVNARMTEKSASGYRLLRHIFRELAPEAVLAISAADAERFAALFGNAERVAVMPNIKFDRVDIALPPDAASGLRAPTLRSAMGLAEDRLLAVLASVREEEEDTLVSVIRELRGNTGKTLPLTIAVAPRHMHRVDAWKEKLSGAGIPWVLRSEGVAAPVNADNVAGPVDPAKGRNSPLSCGNQPPALNGAGRPKEEAHAVMLWDTFGELSALYAVADSTFVGGSLAPLGGQNFLEPAALGVTPLVGPHTFNFSWIGEDFFECGLGVRVEEGTLAECLTRELTRRSELLRGCADGGAASLQAARLAENERMRALFRNWLAPYLGGSAQAATLAASLLADTLPL